MVFMFRSQPLKTFYIIYFVLSRLVVRIPLWIALSIVPTMRARQTWSFGRALLVHILNAYFQLQFNIGFAPPLDPKKQARSADKLGFVWIEPVTDDFVVAEVATAARANNVRPSRISGYWFGKRTPRCAALPCHDSLPLPASPLTILLQ